MAEAGFYHCPSDCEPDLVRCYVCQKELDGWDPTDDPWQVIRSFSFLSIVRYYNENFFVRKEHASHSKACPFVVLNKKQSDMTLVEYLKLEAERQTIRVVSKVKDRFTLNFKHLI